jgi:hypothetical protein
MVKLLKTHILSSSWGEVGVAGGVIECVDTHNVQCFDMVVESMECFDMGVRI